MSTVSYASDVRQGLSCRIHCLNFTSTATLDEIVEGVAENVFDYLGDNPRGLFVRCEHGSQGYERMMTGKFGVRIMWSEGREDVHVQIPGTACEAVDADRLLAFCQSDCVRLRRIDVALDGLVDRGGRNVSPRRIYRMAKQSPERVRTWANLRSAASLQYHENGLGQTVDFGARTSERYVRVYDRRGFTRIEMELKGDRAELVGQILEHRRREELPRIIVGLIRDYIDFVEPDSNKSRANLQGWWHDAVGEFDKVRVAAPQPEQSLPKSYQWLGVQAATALANCMDWAGGDLSIVIDLIDRGRQMRGTRHMKILAEAGGFGAFNREQYGLVGASSVSGRRVADPAGFSTSAAVFMEGRSSMGNGGSMQRPDDTARGRDRRECESGSPALPPPESNDYMPVDSLYPF